MVLLPFTYPTRQALHVPATAVPPADERPVLRPMHERLDADSAAEPPAMQRRHDEDQPMDDVQQ